MPSNNNTIIILFLLSYTFVFYNLFIVEYFNTNIYSQNPITKIKQDLTNKIINNNNNWLNYTDNKENFTTIYPKGWEIIKSKNNEADQTRFLTIFRSPKENISDTFQENIVISIIISNKSTSNNKYNTNNTDIQNIIEKLASNNKDFKLEKVSIININNNQFGKSIKYSFRNSGVDFTTEQIFSIANNKIYIFSLLAEQETFEKYILILNMMLKNFNTIK
jgi:hypothetical protein